MIKIAVGDRIQTEMYEFLKLAIPLASVQVAQSATGFADTVMMGRMGADVLVAGGLAAIIFLSLRMTTSGMVMGTSPLIAEAFVAGLFTWRLRELIVQRKLHSSAACDHKFSE